METVDLADLFMFLSITTVMRQVVVSIGNLDIAVAAVAASVGHHKGGDSRRIGLKRQHHHVTHQPDVLAVVARHAGGPAVFKFAAARGVPLRKLNAPLDFADAGQVFVHFTTVASADSCLQPACVVGDKIENALLQRLTEGGLLAKALLVTVCKQPPKNQSWVDLFSNGRCFRRPGNV